MARGCKSCRLATKQSASSLKPFPALKPAVAYAVVIALWAAIYLPGLGSVEIKGEEVRRIMPGINMLQSGDWIVPQYNGEAYLRKPPLVNWAIAESVKTFGEVNEWTARFPSVLAVLAMSLVMLGVCIPWLGVNAALAAVLITLTMVGMVDKGRLAEIESIYISLFGIAFSIWLAGVATGRSRWAVWPLVGLFLGLGLLAKGPPNLAYFYATVGFTAWWACRRKSDLKTGLLSWPHLLALVIMAAVVALWWIPYSKDPLTAGAAGVMERQIQQRLGGGATSTIALNCLHSLTNFLPWIFGLPLFWSPRTLGKLSPRERILVEGARWPIVICAFALILLPGMLPRYTLPMMIPFTLLLARLLKAELAESRVLQLSLGLACLVAFGMIAYASFFARFTPAPSRKFAARINSQMPAGSPIYIFEPGVQPEVFYIHGKLLFADSVKELPENVPWIVAPDTSLKSLTDKFREAKVLARMQDRGDRGYTLLGLFGNKGRQFRNAQGPMSTPPPSESPKK